VRHPREDVTRSLRGCCYEENASVEFELNKDTIVLLCVICSIFVLLLLMLGLVILLHVGLRLICANKCYLLTYLLTYLSLQEFF